MRRAFALLLGLTFAASLLSPIAAYANDPPKPPPKNDPNAPKPPPPSSLTGNAIPHCELGSYPAGNVCRPARPGFYAGPNATYPKACPAGKTSNYGARGSSECF